MCVCIAVFESILRVKSGDSSIWWVPLNILSLFYNKIYKTENTESSIILNKIRSLLGGSSEHGFREHRPCYIHGRNHVGISDVAKCGKGILAHKPNKIILFTVTYCCALLTWANSIASGLLSGHNVAEQWRIGILSYSAKSFHKLLVYVRQEFVALWFHHVLSFLLSN